ncbi:MAG: XdhC family protein [Gemmatimonadetes bacterium]|nr:XdhC family protein [Gemmatimonadota bacterium]
MLLADEGAPVGSVSGGCLEADVREVALSVIRTATPRLLHYETGDDDQKPWGLGLGCNGAVDIFLQPAAAPELRDAAASVGILLKGDTPFTVSTVVRGSVGLGRVVVVGAEGKLAGSTGDTALDRAVAARAREILVAGESRLHQLETVQVFTEVQLPPPNLLILGAGEDARPLAAYAAEAGFRVTVVDHRRAYLESGHYPVDTRLVHARWDDPSADLPLGPRTYAVVKTHSLAHDREWVKRLLATEAPYIGVLGPRARVETVLRQLGAEGNDRVFGPVGLDLGAEGPEQIALSIVAEVLAVRSGQEPGHLRKKEEAIHAG